MIALLLSPKLWLGVGAGALAVGVWAVASHGPAQYRAGSIETAARLDAATRKASWEIVDAADRGDFLFEQCRVRGGVYDFGAGRCVEAGAD